MAILEKGGDTVIDDSVDEVNVAMPEAPPYDAVIVAIPEETATASPFETEAIAASDEVQIAHVVKFCEAPSAKVPVAMNCSDVPGAMLGGAGGATLIDATGDAVSMVDPDTPPKVAVIVAGPLFKVVVANPFEPCVLLIVAIPVSDESQVADVVRLSLVLFEYVPMAVSCAVVPGAMLGATGVTDIDNSEAGEGWPWSFTLHPVASNEINNAVNKTATHG